MCRAPLLAARATVVAIVQLPREGAKGAKAAAALTRLQARIRAAGYASVQVDWLFANGPAERTLYCEWGAQSPTGAS